MVTLYTVHVDDAVIYLPKDMWDEDYEEEQVTPTAANLTMEDNKSGSFVFSLLPQNLAYDEIDLLKTTIKVTEHVYDDDGSLDSKTILWKGRVISIEEDMTGIKTFTCEGALAFLNDIICYPTTNAIVSDVITSDDGYDSAKEMRNAAFKQALQDYLDDGGNSTSAYAEGSTFTKSKVNTQEFGDCIYSVGNGYNEMCELDRRFRIGKVTIGNSRGVAGFIDVTEADDGAYLPDDYPDGAWMFKGELSTPTAAFASALDQILDVTVDQNGGHLIVRHEEKNGTEQMYLDYFGGFTDADASAEYGVNIIEFTGKIELNSPVTDIIPRGAVISTWNGNEASDDAVDPDYLYVGRTVNFTGNYHYVASTSDVGYKCTAGQAKITNVNYGAKHPIHLIHTGDDSTVYGWVNQSDIQGVSYGYAKFEFVGRQYDSYPYTEYVGIANTGYDGGVHVVNESLMSKYGRIQQTVDFPDISDPAELLEAAEEWLEAHSSFLKQTYEISLVDLGHVYGSGETPIHLLDRVHVYMPNHDIDEYMPVTKIEMDLLNPANTTISFSRETNRSTVRSAKSRAAVAVTDPSVQLNRANDSISQSLARNIQYISENTAHATINTSLSQNNKITLPDGASGNFDLVPSSGSGSTKLTFVNGLLCSSGNSSGPEYDFYDHNDPVIKMPLIKPANPRHCLYIINKNDSSVILDNNIYSYACVIGDGRANSLNVLSYVSTRVPTHPAYAGSDKYVDVYNYPVFYTDGSGEADDLILETDYTEKGYGLYYRMVDGKKQYFASPMIYYLPNNLSGTIYVVVVEPEQEFKSGYGPTLWFWEIKNLGTLASSAGSRKASNLTSEMSFDKIGAKMDNELKLLFRQNRPTNTATSNTVKLSANSFGTGIGTALMIMPMWVSNSSGNLSGGYPWMFICPAFVEASTNYTWIGSSRMPTRLKIYTGRNDVSLPKDYRSVIYSGNSRAWYMGDMMVSHNCYGGGHTLTSDVDIRTNVTDAKYYVFTNKTAANELIEAYKTGEQTQSTIESAYKSSIIALGNRAAQYDDYQKLQLSYLFKNASGYTTSSHYIDSATYLGFSGW